METALTLLSRVVGTRDRALFGPANARRDDKIEAQLTGFDLLLVMVTRCVG